MSHPDEGLIHAWLDGELDAAAAARVQSLVESDAEWAAAAAEARGLIAASARIVGALDRVPANVVPKSAAVRAGSRRWMWRAAAVLALMAGSAVVLERQEPRLSAPTTGRVTAAAAPATPAPTPANPIAAAQVAPAPPHAEAAGAAVAKKTEPPRTTLDQPKPVDLARDKDLAAVRGDVAANSAGAPAVARRAANAPMEAKAQPQAAAQGAPAAATVAPQEFAPQRLTRLPVSCFAQLVPRDSTAPLIRLTAAALADSVRLETLVLRGGGDTLAAVNGRFTAVRVRCPEP